MLSFSIRQQLKALLLQIAKQEKQLEVLRQILCEQYDFEPYSAFQRLDADRKGYLLPIDICEFLTENEIPITKEDAYLYIRHYAEENPQSLTYPEY